MVEPHLGFAVSDDGSRFQRLCRCFSLRRPEPRTKNKVGITTTGAAGGRERKPSSLRAEISLILIRAFVSIHVRILSEFNVTAFMNNPWACCVYSFIPWRVRFPHSVLFNTPGPVFPPFPSFWLETSLDWTGASTTHGEQAAGPAPPATRPASAGSQERVVASRGSGPATGGVGGWGGPRLNNLPPQ